MGLTDKHIAEKFAAFHREQKPAMVLEALEMLETAEQHATGETDGSRGRRLDLWIVFFEALDREIDLAWDAREMPVKGVPPPPSSDGMISSSGEVDPAMIRDAAERMQYVEAIKANREYEEKYRVQLQLRRIDEQAMAGLGRLLARHYPGASTDLEAFSTKLSESRVSDSRRERLKAFLPS